VPAHVQRLVSVVKRATVLEEYNTDEQRFVVQFLWAKTIHNWVEKFSQGRSKVADEETEVRKWLRQQYKTLLCCGFRRTGKATGQVYQCWWRICREINVFFQVRISHVLRFISICDIFIDSPSYICKRKTQSLALEYFSKNKSMR
jgi:hypothetical protein